MEMGQGWSRVLRLFETSHGLGLDARMLSVVGRSFKLGSRCDGDYSNPSNTPHARRFLLPARRLHLLEHIEISSLLLVVEVQ